jgi:hypothetical protein
VVVDDALLMVFDYFQEPRPERVQRASGRHQSSRQKENQSHIHEQVGVSVSLWELLELHKASQCRGEFLLPLHCCYTAVKRMRT